MHENLAPYASCPENSQGRIFHEEESQLRSCFQRDRDRIIHSSAFRRLDRKTQVFVDPDKDNVRTRLTHSLEVSQIARTISRELGLNEDLTEAICLAHDLGHPPFGHAGQDILNECMLPYGGFEHNLQSLRIVDLLEHRYANFLGLNLTFETREGILKHCDQKTALNLGEIGKRFINRTQPSLEAQLANIADLIAYNHHDIDDGLRAKILNINDFIQFDWAKSVIDKIEKNKDFPKLMNYEFVRILLNLAVLDLIEETKKNLIRFNIKNTKDVRTSEKTIISFSDNLKNIQDELKNFLMQNFYLNDQVKKLSDQAEKVIPKLFNFFLANPKNLPPYFYEQFLIHTKSPGQEPARIICDYIAGMTDRFALNQYNEVPNDK